MIELYIKLLNSLDLIIREDGAVMIDDDTPLKVSNIPLYLPYEHNYKSTIENGKKVKYIFNPLNENRLSGVNKELTKILNIYNVRLNTVIKYITVGIFTVMADKNKSTYPLFLTSLMGELNKAKGNAKKLVDEPLLSRASSIVNDHDLYAMKLKLKHGIQVDFEKVNSAVALSTPIIKLLEDEKFLPSARKKDKRALKTIYSWIANYLTQNDENILSTSSHDDVPDFIALIKAMHIISDRIKPLGEYIESTGMYESLLEIDIEPSDLNCIDEMVLEAKLIPDADTSSTVIDTPHLRPTKTDDEIEVITSPEQLNKAMKPAVTVTPAHAAPVAPTVNYTLQPETNKNLPPAPYQVPVTQYNQPIYGQPQYGQPQYGQPQYAQPYNGQPQYAQPYNGQPQYGQPQYAQPYNDNSSTLLLDALKGPNKKW